MSFLNHFSWVEIFAVLISVIFFGYNLSMFLNRYSAFCEKALKYREILQSNNTDLIQLRRMNVLLLCVFWIFYEIILFSSGFKISFLLLISLKFLISLYYSDRFQCCVVEESLISKSLYWQIKLDSLLNFSGIVFLSLLLVRMI